MFEDFLNKFDVIYLDITWFISIVKNVRDVVCYLQEQVISELRSVMRTNLKMQWKTAGGKEFRKIR